MAAIDRSFPIQIQGSEIQFGEHALPMATARDFWIYANRKDGSMVSIHVSGEDKDVTYQMWTLTADKTNKLVRELFEKTDAKLTFPIKEIMPSVDGVTFRFYPEDVGTFHQYVAPHFFPQSDFYIQQQNTEIRVVSKFDGDEKEKIEKIRAVLKKLSLRIDHHVVAKRLGENDDPTFIIDYPEPDTALQRRVSEGHPSLRAYVIEETVIRRVQFSTQIREEVAADAEEIYDWLRGPVPGLSRS